MSLSLRLSPPSSPRMGQSDAGEVHEIGRSARGPDRPLPLHGGRRGTLSEGEPAKRSRVLLAEVDAEQGTSSSWAKLKKRLCTIVGMTRQSQDCGPPSTLSCSTRRTTGLDHFVLGLDSIQATPRSETRIFESS